MKKVIFGGFCMLTGMLMLIYLQIAEIVPDYHDFGVPMLILALVVTCGGFLTGVLGLMKKEK